MNLVKARVTDNGLDVEGTTLPLPTGTRVLKAGTEVELGLRPEWFSTEAGPDTVPLTAYVELIEPTGPDIYAALQFGGQSLMARLPARSAAQAGTNTQFHVDMQKAVIFDTRTGSSLMADA
jgi:multiple sugar transport system ATP-binding protein